MPASLSVVSTKPERALGRRAGRIRPGQGRGCVPAPC